MNILLLEQRINLTFAILTESFHSQLVGLNSQISIFFRIPSMQAGTYGFMSPEVVLCSHASPFSDMWCLGVVVYMMVSGGIEPFWQVTLHRSKL